MSGMLENHMAVNIAALRTFSVNITVLDTGCVFYIIYKLMSGMSNNGDLDNRAAIVTNLSDASVLCAGCVCNNLRCVLMSCLGVELFLEHLAAL